MSWRRSSLTWRKTWPSSSPTPVPMTSRCSFSSFTLALCAVTPVVSWNSSKLSIFHSQNQIFAGSMRQCFIWAFHNLHFHFKNHLRSQGLCKKFNLINHFHVQCVWRNMKLKLFSVSIWLLISENLSVILATICFLLEVIWRNMSRRCIQCVSQMTVVHVDSASELFHLQWWRT